jgi:hypothetical protein
MKHTLTILLLLQFTVAMAQRVKFSPPETRYPDYASFEIIGHINGHILIYIEGIHGAEIGVFDENMNKIRSVPASFLNARVVRANFLTYQDHFLLFLQYYTETTTFISVLTGDGDGGGLESMSVLDSIQMPKTRFPASKGQVGPTLTFPPFLVLRSENKQWFMILKGSGVESTDQQLEATLYDKDLKPLEHTRLTCSTEEGHGGFADFILDNDGDLAFTLSSFEDRETNKIMNAKLFIKPHGTDSLISKELSIPDGILDHLNLQVDNVNHRYILNTLYSKWGNANLTGLCSLIWDKRSQSLESTTLTPLSTQLLTEARSDFSPPEQVLNYYYLRQVVPMADGGFMVLAELCYGREKFNNYTSEVKRSDFIWETPSVLTASYLSMNSANPERPGYWESTGKDRFGNHGAYGIGRNTDNLLVFNLDRDGKARSIKVIHKSEYTTPGMGTLSFQAFNDGKAIHLMYNENIKGHWFPVGTSINTDGTIGRDPVLPGLGQDQLLFPRYGKQVGPKTAIIPGQDKENLFFARVDFE